MFKFSLFQIETLNHFIEKNLATTAKYFPIITVANQFNNFLKMRR